MYGFNKAFFSISYLYFILFQVQLTNYVAGSCKCIGSAHIWRWCCSRNVEMEIQQEHKMGYFTGARHANTTVRLYVPSIGGGGRLHVVVRVLSDTATTPDTHVHYRREHESKRSDVTQRPLDSHSHFIPNTTLLFVHTQHTLHYRHATIHTRMHCYDYDTPHFCCC